MRHFKPFTIFNIFLSFSFFFNSAIAESLLTPNQLIASIQQGGYVLYVRHAATDHSQKDSDRSNFSDCKTQRNLSKIGLQDAKRIGLAIQKMAIPISSVNSSPYCRAKDTAHIIFGKAEIDNNLQFSISKNAQESKELGNYLKQAMINAEPNKSNVVFVGHTSNLRDGLGIWPKPEGAVAVFKKENSKMYFRGIIKPSDWPSIK